MNGQCVLVSVGVSSVWSTSASGTYATGLIAVSCSSLAPTVSTTTVSPTFARRRTGWSSKRMRWRGASSSEKLNAPPGAPPSGPLPRVSDMPRGYDATKRPLPKARRKRSTSRSAAQRATSAPSSAWRSSRTVAVLHVDVRRADALVARALEILGEAQQACEPVEALGVAGARQRLQLPEVRLALAVVAGGLRDERDLGRREPGQAGVEDEVARVLVVVVVVDRHPDVVQHARRPQQLALAGIAVVQPLGGELVEQPEGEGGDVVRVRAVDAVLPRPGSARSRGGRRRTGGPARGAATRRRRPRAGLPP